MKNFSIKLLLIILTFSSLIACSTQTAEEKRQEELKDSAKELANSAQDLAEKIGNSAEGSVNEAMKGMEEAVNKFKEGKDLKDPVNFRELKPLLPEALAGFDRTDISGKTSGAMGFKFTTVAASYKNNDQVVEISLVDAGGLGSTLMGAAFWSELDIDEESDKGFKRTLEIDGKKSYQECKNNNQDCQLAMIVGERFVLSIEGRDTNMDQLLKMAKSIDLDELEGM